MTLWQQLGGFVYSGKNLGRDIVDIFKASGGTTIYPVVYQDDEAELNLSLVPQWRSWGVTVGGSFSCFAKKDPLQEAADIAAVVNAHHLDPVMLDCELEYQFPGGKWDDMPILAAEVRRLLPKANLCITTNGGPDGAKIWNGKNLTPKQSMYDLGIRVSPQWYSSYYNKDGRTPDNRMLWLKENGSKNENTRDDNAWKTSYRGLPLSYVHAMLEATGVEGSDLHDELLHLKSALKYGYTKGVIMFPLERTPTSDFEILRFYRGRLYL